MEWITEYIHLLGDPAHWAFELTVQLLIDGLLIGVGFRLGMRWLKRHDRKHHHVTELRTHMVHEVPCPVDGRTDHHEHCAETERIAEAHRVLAMPVTADDWWLTEMEAARQRKLRAIDKMDPAARLIYLKAHPEMIEEDF